MQWAKGLCVFHCFEFESFAMSVCRFIVFAFRFHRGRIAFIYDSSGPILISDVHIYRFCQLLKWSTGLLMAWTRPEISNSGSGQLVAKANTSSAILTDNDNINLVGNGCIQIRQWKGTCNNFEIISKCSKTLWTFTVPFHMRATSMAVFMLVWRINYKTHL